MKKGSLRNKKKQKKNMSNIQKYSKAQRELTHIKKNKNSTFKVRSIKKKVGRKYTITKSVIESKWTLQRKSTSIEKLKDASLDERIHIWKYHFKNLLEHSWGRK